MSPAVDLVLVFKGTSRSLSKTKALEDAQNAEADYTRLIQTLTAAGLKATGRRGQRQGQLLVIIWATPHKVAQLVQKERHSDFLLGLPSSTLPAQARDFVASPLSPADRLRLVHDYITSLESEGGLGIVPGLWQWSRVESIMALQDHAFNENWIRSWTRRQIGFHMGFGELSKIRDQVRWLSQCNTFPDGMVHLVWRICRTLLRILDVLYPSALFPICSWHCILVFLLALFSLVLCDPHNLVRMLGRVVAHSGEDHRCALDHSRLVPC